MVELADIENKFDYFIIIVVIIVVVVVVANSWVVVLKCVGFVR